ncbi:hypothetical protein C493_03185 [Natronolimnohabitans innermongolicus JCM 12255]|uniref:Uncharacterized protein n=1 Tax=Natronolimnohabitans innermongolicus JCM 12255 TaxID=1227499 RepID=L9XH75_9EURY|nr:hypothetical protein C493_03185 [Natronolimnohabitans innermongolicus JCM 12255]
MTGRDGPADVQPLCILSAGLGSRFVVRTIPPLAACSTAAPRPSVIARGPTVAFEHRRFSYRSCTPT